MCFAPGETRGQGEERKVGVPQRSDRFGRYPRYVVEGDENGRDGEEIQKTAEGMSHFFLLFGVGFPAEKFFRNYM